MCDVYWACLAIDCNGLMMTMMLIRSSEEGNLMESD